MVTRRRLLEELDLRTREARDRGDFPSAELYTMTALRVFHEPDLAVSGQRQRAARQRAAELAPIPLGERFTAAP